MPSVTEIRPQRFSGGVPTRRYMFRGFETALDVDARLQQFLPEDEIPLSWGGIPADVPGRVIDEAGFEEWYVEMPYRAAAGSIVQPGAGTATQPTPQHGGAGGAAEPVMYDISYAVRGGTQKITQSIRTVKKQAIEGLTPRDYGRAINVTERDGKLEAAGLDVVAGEVAFTRNVLIPAGAFTGAYAKVVENLLCSPQHRRASKNAAKFFGYEAGEVLFVDFALGTVDGSGHRPATFQFAVKRNRPIVTLCEDPTLELEDVGGWSYVWCTYRERVQTVGGKDLKVLVPFEAYEEEVYEDGNFAALRIEEFRVSPPTP